MKKSINKYGLLFLVLFCICSCSQKKTDQMVNDEDSTQAITYPIIFKNDKPQDEKIHTVKLKKIFEIKRDDNASIYVSCADKSNNFYATHWFKEPNGGDEIYIYDSTGKIKKSFGRRGQGPGEYENPYNIDVNKDSLLLYDPATRKIVKYDLNGNHLTTSNTQQQGISHQIDSILIFSGLRQKLINKSKFLVENVWEIYNSKNNIDTIFWSKSCETDGKISKDILDISIVDLSNKLIYLTTMSTDKYEIEVFDFTGKNIGIINKRYAQVALTNQDRKILQNEDIYAQAINNLFVDKKGRLLVSANALRSSHNQTDYYLDVFENGKYLFRTILPEIYFRIYSEDRIVFINDRLYISKAGEKAGDPNVLTCYEYEIE